MYVYARVCLCVCQNSTQRLPIASFLETTPSKGGSQGGGPGGGPGGSSQGRVPAAPMGGGKGTTERIEERWEA